MSATFASITVGDAMSEAAAVKPSEDAPLVTVSITPALPGATAASTSAASLLPEVVSAVSACSDEFVLTSLPASYIPLASGALLNLLLFATSPSRHFSYTHTAEELSLLLDAHTARTAFPQGMLTGAGTGDTWRIVEIVEGSEIIDTPGIVSSLCAPLFKQPQPMNELLYLSTFLSDLILVRPQHVDLAAEVVSRNLGFLIESRQRAAAAEAERRRERAAGREPGSPPAVSSPSLSSAVASTTASPMVAALPATQPRAHSEEIAMHLSKLPFELSLLTLHASHLHECSSAILRALLHGNSATPADPSVPAHFRPSFFSFTQAGTQVSLIVESSCVAAFPAHRITRHASVWNALQISQGSESTDSAGLVAPLSSILAQVGVSIFYVSTCTLDYILVAEREVELALTTLQRHMNVAID